MKALWKQEWAVAALLIFVLAGMGYGLLWRKGEILYSPHSDIIAQGLGGKTVLYKALREGRGIPFWREDQFSGYSAFINPQALYTYPLHFLFYVYEPADATGRTLWLHFVAAAWVLYLVGTALGLGRWAKLLMAVSALFGFKLVIAAYAGWLPVIPAIICFPLLFAATFYLLNRPGLGGTLAVAAAVALCLHTGHLQLFYYTIWFLTIYLLRRAVALGRANRWRTLRQAVGQLLCGGILGAGMAAYLLIPLAAEAPLISRAEASYTFFVSNHALTLRHLLTFLYPEALGSPLDGSYDQVELWEDVGYFGIIQLALAIVGAVWGWGRRSHTRFLVGSFLLSLIMTVDSPLLRFLYNVLPGFQLFHCPSRFLFLTAFFGIVIAGIGLEETIARMTKRYSWPLLAPLFAGLLLLLVGTEGIFYARRYLTTVPHQQVLPVTAYQRFLASDRTVFRVATLHGPTVNYGWSASMNLQIIGGYDPYNFCHYQEYFDLLQWGAIRSKEARMWTDLVRISRNDLLDALNVKYLVSPVPLLFPAGQFEQVGHWNDQPVFVFYLGMRQSDIYIYRNNHFLPRAFWVSETVEAKDETNMIALIKRKQLSHTAIILDSAQRSFPCSTSGEDRVEVLDAYGGYLTLQVQNQARRFLVISEIWHPGWRAFIDGRKLQLHRTDMALMGTWIPPGKHRLEIRFRPLYWPVALGISGVSSGIFLILMIILCRQSRRANVKPIDCRKRRTKKSNMVKNKGIVDA